MRRRAWLLFFAITNGAQSAGSQELSRRYTKDEAYSLGVAELATLVAKEYCSGRETAVASSIYNSASVQQQQDFAAGQSKMRDKLRPIGDQIKQPFSAANRAFCDDVAQKYGPRGRVWPGLYQP